MSKLYSVSIFNSIIIIIIVYVSNVPYYYSSHIGLNNIEDNILIFTKCTNTYVFIMHRYLRKFLQFQNKVYIIYTIHSIPMSLIPCDKSLPPPDKFVWKRCRNFFNKYFHIGFQNLQSIPLFDMKKKEIGRDQI